MSIFRSIFSIAILTSFIWSLGAVVSAPASAADCERSFLDKRYCDRDGNLTADLPLDPKDWVNPSTIIFSYTPVEDPAVYKKVWDGFIQHMAKVTGKRVVFFPVQSYAAQYEAMRSGRLHIAGVNTGGNPVAVACAGFVPFAMMASKDGSFGYEMEIIAPADSRNICVPRAVSEQFGRTSIRLRKACVMMLQPALDRPFGPVARPRLPGAILLYALGCRNHDDRPEKGQKRL